MVQEKSTNYSFKKINDMSANRRKFLQQVTTLGGIGMISSLPSIVAEGKEVSTSIEQDKDNQITEITILQTTDVHCQIHAHDEFFWENNQAVFRKTGGYAHLATYLQQKRKKLKHSFLIDTGDMFQGSALSVKTTGKAMVPILNALNYDLYLPGNWEVIYYKQAMQTLLGSLSAPKVCANMYHDLGNGVKGELVFPPYYIWVVNGIKIGFLGYTDHLVPIRQSPNYSKGIVYTPPEENLSHYVKVLREHEQCAAVLVVAHLGLSQQIHLSNLPACEGVDYILGGDTHERVRVPIQGKYAKVVEPGAFGSFVGELTLQFSDGKLIKDAYSLAEVDASKYVADQSMTTLIQQLENPYMQSLQEVVGYSTIPLYRYFVIENPIDTLILEALKWQIQDVDIVLSNGFRFCPPRTTSDKTGNIPITAGFIYDMLPVDSTVRTAQVTGAQLKEWLEKELHNVFAENAVERFGGWVIKFTGMKVTFNAFAPKGKRVVSVYVGGEELRTDKTYKICACEREGDPDDMLCRIKQVKQAKNTQYTLHSVMKNYLAVNSPVTPTPKKSAIVLDAPQDLLTQVHGVPYEFK